MFGAVAVLEGAVARGGARFLAPGLAAAEAEVQRGILMLFVAGAAGWEAGDVVAYFLELEGEEVLAQRHQQELFSLKKTNLSYRVCQLFQRSSSPFDPLSSHLSGDLTRQSLEWRVCQST